MKTLLSALAVALTLGLAAPESEAKRLGGGGNLGKQRATPAQNQAAPAQPATPTPSQASPTPAPAAAAAAAKPSFMQRWGGMLAGLGIGVLLASMFGAQMGPIIGMILAVMLGFGILFLLFKLFAGRGNGASPAMAGAPGAASGDRPRFNGIGSTVDGARVEPVNFQSSAPQGSGAAQPRAAVVLPPDVELQPFLRVAKTSFIRLQAANDAGDMADIRDFTTPEVYAEVAMQFKERGAATQKTEVVSVEAQLVDFATEDGFDIASVRFTGLIRENDAANPESFDEIWHVRRKAGDRKDAWLIAGIQQYA
ncbi:Tim44 domain-containing protein [Usitatibacter palustris]|uniref:Tim44-like domain-containing protein n=1 Tax=Usitatibacter palustris TaxID=2732487 RepID=A0A6M4H7I2_9PROT|nr:TIM44-like domain-containing protein [Usitatibacter palustris]QJR15125.1 hypothetical protein DSM104440_01942 [Usitatibacter palustris]